MRKEGGGDTYLYPLPLIDYPSGINFGIPSWFDYSQRAIINIIIDYSLGIIDYVAQKFEFWNSNIL